MWKVTVETTSSKGIDFVLGSLQRVKTKQSELNVTNKTISELRGSDIMKVNKNRK